MKDKDKTREELLSELRNLRLKAEELESNDKSRERALLKSEEQYRLIFENAFDVIMTFDTGLKVLSVSPSVIRALGYSPEELVGKTLPSLAEFNIRLDPESVKDKMILVCFWDMEQKPSRNCILTLNKRVRALLEEDVYMIFIHAEPVAEPKLIAWLKENKIQPTIGTNAANLPKLRQTWGVKALPWMILTDKEHVVVDDGFLISGLDEKITKSRE